MPTAYVYAALSGTITQINGSGHTPCTDGGTPSALKPLDIGAGSGTAIRLYVNYPTVRSIDYSMTTGNPFECCDGLVIPGNPNLENNLKRAVKVYLYAEPNFGCYLGWVLFGHINQTNFSLVSGNISQSDCGQLGTVINANGFGCYTGAHLHMECSSGGQYASGIAAGNPVTGGTTQLYRWTVSQCPSSGDT